MADQGFANVFPLLLPVRANRQELPEDLKKYLMSLLVLVIIYVKTIVIIMIPNA